MGCEHPNGSCLMHFRPGCVGLKAEYCAALRLRVWEERAGAASAGEGGAVSVREHVWANAARAGHVSLHICLQGMLRNMSSQNDGTSFYCHFALHSLLQLGGNRIL